MSTEVLVAAIVIFTLSTFLGVELIGRVPPTLHTPLMSGANAVSGITIVGALIIAGSGLGWISNILGFIAIVLAMMNVAGGYAVTDRMLGMFRAKSEGKR
jgi:NAD(P) transhydrogenase subunit alpha